MKRFVFLVLAVTMPSFVEAGVETPIPLSELPEKVRKAIEKRFPSISLIDANTEKEDDGTLVYEVRGKIAAGQFLEGEYGSLLPGEDSLMDFTPKPPSFARRVEFDVNPNGTFEEIEIEFAADMVPGAVMQALQTEYPGFVATFIEASYSDSMHVVGYELEGNFKQQKLDIELSPSGRDIRLADQ